MKMRENRVIHINCLRKNGIHNTFGDSSDSVDKERSDKSVKQMPTIELIKPIKSQAELDQPAAVSSEPACGVSLELMPAKKKIRIRECSDLRHWWDDEAVQEESFECA